MGTGLFAHDYAKTRVRYLYLTVFVGGLVTLAIEFSASRLLGSVFGTSNLIWANVIGLIMLYLAAGYFLGGRWADRSPHYATLYRILIWSAFFGALIPLIARPVLRAAALAFVDAQVSLSLGSFIAVIVLFAVPITLLGCISPFAIRLAVPDRSGSGRVAGQIYAVSTLGSLVGTFVPTFLLIPTLGTFRTFLLVAAVLFVVGCVGLWQHRGPRAALRYLWMPLLVAVLAHFALQGPLRPAAEGAALLYDGESAYNYIQVQEDAQGYRYLYLNEGQGIHSQWHPDIYTYNRTWSYFLTAPYFNAPPVTPDSPRSLLIIGLAAGTIARQYTHVYGDIPIDGVEIDPAIVDVGARFFDMNPDAMPNLTVYAQDGRFVLNQLTGPYSVVAVDAYRPPYIPWHLTTVEFFQEVRDHLTPDGVVAINVGRTATDRRLVDALAATLGQVFPSVHALDVPRSFNTILVATSQPTDPANLASNLAALPPSAPAALRDTLTLAAQTLSTVAPSATVFTDDHAPVETLVDSLVLNFLLSGEVEQLR